jgi:hypothetical protein
VAEEAAAILQRLLFHEEMNRRFCPECGKPAHEDPAPGTVIAEKKRGKREQAKSVEGINFEEGKTWLTMPDLKIINELLDPGFTYPIYVRDVGEGEEPLSLKELFAYFKQNLLEIENGTKIVSIARASSSSD